MKLSNSLKDLSSGQLHLFVNVLLDRETMRTYSGTFLTCGVKSLTHCPFGKLCESSAMHFLFLWTLEWTKAGGGWGGVGRGILPWVLGGWYVREIGWPRRGDRELHSSSSQRSHEERPSRWASGLLGRNWKAAVETRERTRWHPPEKLSLTHSESE